MTEKKNKSPKSKKANINNNNHSKEEVKRIIMK